MPAPYRYDIRPLADDEFEVLAQIARATFEEAFGAANDPEHIAAYLATLTAGSFRLEAQRESARFFLVERDDGAFAGYMKLREKRVREAVIPGERPMEIERLYVRNADREHGIRRLLMDKALDVATESGADTLWLGVWERDEGSSRFFTDLGFEEVGSYTFHMGEDPQRDLILARSLT